MLDYRKNTRKEFPVNWTSGNSHLTTFFYVVHFDPRCIIIHNIHFPLLFKMQYTDLNSIRNKENVMLIISYLHIWLFPGFRLRYITPYSIHNIKREIGNQCTIQSMYTRYYVIILFKYCFLLITFAFSFQHLSFCYNRIYNFSFLTNISIWKFVFWLFLIRIFISERFNV